MWRAAIRFMEEDEDDDFQVSIPRTVCGGLQYHHLSSNKLLALQVSIPRTVCGGLQSEAPAGYPRGNSRVSIPRTVCGGLQCCAISHQ